MCPAAHRGKVHVDGRDSVATLMAVNGRYRPELPVTGQILLETFILLTLAAAMLVAAVYAHMVIPGLAHSRRQVAVARVILLGTGLGFAVMMMRLVPMTYPEVGFVRLALVFLASFGVVHLPAACIGWLKRLRRSQ